MKKPAFTIEFERGRYAITKNLRIRTVLRWTWRVRAANGKLIQSSTSQLYSRRIDAKREAEKFLKACKDGLVSIEVEK